MSTLTATYNPDDNKLRLYASSRLDSETYSRVKAEGFKWAPKQDLFVAPCWTPSREDLLIELAGEIEDEDRTLVDRAEERAERFEDYSGKRQDEAQRAREAVKRIADGIPFGQPILVGHHSERHARRDAQRIEDGMRKAIKLWDTSKYWTQRAAAALSHAKYKERPDVRHRRIKTIEADKRKQERILAEAQARLKGWEAADLSREKALLLAANSYRYFRFTLTEYPRDPSISQYEGEMSLWSAVDHGIINAEQARELALPGYHTTIAHATRWITHYENRLSYERAMLEEMGGTVADRAEIEVGGRVLVGGEWLVVLRVNKTSGIINSLTTTPPIGVHWRKDWKHGIEEIKGYKAPSKDDAAKVKTATKLPPLCNYPGEGFLHMTKKEYDETVPKWSDFQKIGTLNSTETYGRHRVRQTRAPGGEYWQTALVYLTDQKRTDPPKPVPQPEFEAQMEALPEPKPTRLKPAKAAVVEFEAMRDSLKHGVQMVNTPQLFPTPPDLAERMVELAEIKTHHRVLEPSAGTGNIWRNLSGKRQGVEIHPDLANRLRDMVTQGDFGIICADFLECSPKELGNFDRIVMNPPFSNGQDIKHIQHALTMLKPGGRLVALCANGSRQQEQLKPVADYWEDLPSGSFASQGTGVNVALLTINIPDKLPAVKRRPAIQLELFGA